MKRFAPLVGAPYGTHQNCCTPSFSRPRTWPYCVFAVPPTLASRRSCAAARSVSPPNARLALVATLALKKVLRSSPEPSLPRRDAIESSPEFLIERLAWPNYTPSLGRSARPPGSAEQLCSGRAATGAPCQRPPAARVNTTGSGAPPSFSVPEICVPSALNEPVKLAGVTGDVSVRVRPSLA